GGKACTNVAAWDAGSGWRPLGAGLPGQVNDVLSAGGELYAAGDFFTDPVALDSHANVARWRDGRWESFGPPMGPVDRLGWYRGHLVASQDGRIARLGADSTWHAFGSGTNGYVLAMLESGPSLFVAGFFSRAGRNPAYGFAEWREDVYPGLPI